MGPGSARPQPRAPVVPSRNGEPRLRTDTGPRDGVSSWWNPAYKERSLIPGGGRPKSHPDGMCPSFGSPSFSGPPASLPALDPLGGGAPHWGAGDQGPGAVRALPWPEPPYLLLPTQTEIRPLSEPLTRKLGRRIDSGHQDGDSFNLHRLRLQEGKGRAGCARTTGLLRLRGTNSGFLFPRLPGCAPLPPAASARQGLGLPHASRVSVHVTVERELSGSPQQSQG